MPTTTTIATIIRMDASRYIPWVREYANVGCLATLSRPRIASLVHATENGVNRMKCAIAIKMPVEFLDMS